MKTYSVKLIVSTGRNGDGNGHPIYLDIAYSFNEEVFNGGQKRARLAKKESFYNLYLNLNAEFKKVSIYISL